MNINILLLILLFSLILIFACRQEKEKDVEPAAADLAAAPQWAREAVWYQIFVERFRNGDTSNDPTPEDIKGAYPEEIPAGWAVTPWGHDWYKPDTWWDEVPLPNYWDRLQLRRFGGDLQGVIDRLDYLQDLGINAIYFNPLNDAPSLHKYDPRHWRHIDRNFGPAPKEDIEIIKTENPIDPSTWKWTNADKLFLQLIEDCHKRGIRVILDYSWNHTGKDFWALNDIREKGAASPYADWFHIDIFDDPATPEDEMAYQGWAGTKYLPELRKDTTGEDKEIPFEGNLANAKARQHIFNVASRWLDPDGDGDPGDGIDGFRLDVAAEVPLGFWREFRRHVRSINPDAYLVGEVWWKNWPDELLDPREFLQGDMFDAVMNYHWYKPARHFFAEAPTSMKPSAFVAELKNVLKGIRTECLEAMMNLTSSHDSPRTSTDLYNKGKYKYLDKPHENPEYKIDKPDQKTRAIQKMLLIHQFTFVGSPHVWYGDEVGMWGADDPDTRKPMVWDDLTYEDETVHPLGKPRKVDKVEQDKELLDYYKQLIRIRKALPALAHGDITFTLIDDENNTLAYSRRFQNVEVIAAFNRSEAPKRLEIPVEMPGKYRNALKETETFEVQNGRLSVELGAMEGLILKLEEGR
jgi:cyclomaltodextrinase / maltogenic alpha-amylase / neopullulanase